MLDELDVDALSEADLVELLFDWSLWGRVEQQAPAGDWRIWLIMAGRGWGKTRTMAELVHTWARRAPVRIAIVGRTLEDARKVLVEGESGVLACARPGEVEWSPGLKQLRWGNGSLAECFSAERPDQLRGPQFHAAIGDEVATWRDVDGYHALDMLRLCVRLGDLPQVALATTPRPTKRMRTLVAEPRVVVTRGATSENEVNLAPSFVDAMRERYGGTRLGRQELDGELLEAVDGALWTTDLIHAHRVLVAPSSFSRVLVAVDPAMTSGPDSDETGIVAVGAKDGEGYVLGDYSGRFGPTEWLRVAVEAAVVHGAEALLVEDNTLRDALRPLLRAAGVTLPVRTVTAYKSKHLRATPIVSLYEQGKIHHVGEHALLEDQMVTWVPERGSSPDRVDALVHGLTELRLVRPVAAAVGVETDPLAAAMARGTTRKRMV